MSPSVIPRLTRVNGMAEEAWEEAKEESTAASHIRKTRVLARGSNLPNGNNTLRTLRITPAPYAPDPNRFFSAIAEHGCVVWG
jgi:hypothetical protein